MGADKLTLEIAIKTTLEGAGLKPTEAEVKALTQQIDAATAAGQKLDISSADLAKRLERLRSSASDSKAPIDGLGESARKAGESTRAAGDASKTTAQNLGEFQRAGNGANQMLAGLERASRGGIDGILGAATAVRGFVSVLRTAAVATGPIGIAAAVVAGLAASMLAIGRDTKAKESIEELARKADALGKVRMDNLARDLKAAADGAAAAKTAFDAAAAAKERLDNAEQAALLAQIRADPKRSEEQKLIDETKVRNDFRARDQQRVNDKNDFAVTQAERQASAAKDATQRPTEDLKNAIAKLDALLEQNRSRDADRARLSELRLQGFPSDRADEIDAIGKRLNTGKDVSQKEIDAARERVRTAVPAADKSREEQAKADTAAREARENRDRELATQAQENEFFKNQQRANLATDLPKARIADAAEQQADKDLKKQIDDLTKARTEEKKAVDAQIDALNESIRGANPGDGNAQAIAAQRDALTKQQKDKEEAYQKELASLRSKLSTATDGLTTAVLNGADKVANALINGAAKVTAAANAAIAAAEKPAPLTPTSKVPATPSTPAVQPPTPAPSAPAAGTTTKDGVTRPVTHDTHATVTKNGVKSSFAETSPGLTRRAVEARPVENVQKEIGDPAADNVSGESATGAPPVVITRPTPSPVAEVQQQNNTALNDVATAIDSAPKLEPLNVDPLLQATARTAQENLNVHRRSIAAIKALQEQQADQAKELSQLWIALRNQAEMHQS